MPDQDGTAEDRTEGVAQTTAPAVFPYLDREIEVAPRADELEPLDVDREAFELAQRAEAGQKPAIAGRALLVCSPGGHLAEMLSLEPAWRDLETTWVTLPGADVDHLLADKPVILGHGPTNRSITKLIRNFRVAWRTVRDLQPDVILSTGAALAVPFFVVGRLHGRRCVYVESLTRREDLSLSGRLVYPLASAFFVQWPTLTRRLRKAVHAGSIL